MIFSRASIFVSARLSPLVPRDHRQPHLFISIDVRGVQMASGCILAGQLELGSPLPTVY